MQIQYYKYKFILADNLFAKIEEEFRSYFATGAIDNYLFPTWVDHCIRHLGKAGMPLVNDVIEICDFKGKLPHDFIKAKEVWACQNIAHMTYPNPSAVYTEVSSKMFDSSDPGTTNCGISCDFPEEVKVIYKTIDRTTYYFHKEWLLIPGNINVKKHCAGDCINLDGRRRRYGTFDIQGNQMITDFREGNVFIVYYSGLEDDEGRILIPDDYWIQEYIEAYIKYKLFEQLGNQVTDESANQINQKMIFYKQASDEAYVNMNTESKKHTLEGKLQSINQTRGYNRKYIIP